MVGAYVVAEHAHHDRGRARHAPRSTGIGLVFRRMALPALLCRGTSQEVSLRISSADPSLAILGFALISLHVTCIAFTAVLLVTLLAHRIASGAPTGVTRLDTTLGMPGGVLVLRVALLLLASLP